MAPAPWLEPHCVAPLSVVWTDWLTRSGGARVAREIPVLKVACSNHVRVNSFRVPLLRSHKHVCEVQPAIVLKQT